jgi:drug/metabolite transporter (DMT)-like permease
MNFKYKHLKKSISSNYQIYRIFNIASITFVPMSTKKSNYLIPGIVISMLIWGLGWPSTKILTGFGTPIHIAIIRFFLTSITLFIILLLMKQKLVIAKSGILYLLIASAIMAIYTMLFLIGVKKGTPGAGGVLVTTMTPIITYALSIIISKKTPSRNEIIGFALGILAACFLLHIWHDFSSMINSGNIFFILSCCTWAVLSRITAKAQQFGSPLTFSFWMYILCFVFLFPFASNQELFSIVQIKDSRYLLNLFFSAIVNTGLATTFYFYATSQMGAAKTSSFIYIVPFAAAFFSWLILNETFHWNTIVGGLLGISAVLFINKKEK